MQAYSDVSSLKKEEQINLRGAVADHSSCWGPSLDGDTPVYAQEPPGCSTAALCENHPHTDGVDQVWDQPVKGFWTRSVNLYS